MKILIVDDNVAIQEIIRDILVDEGHIIRLSGNVHEAVSKIEDFHPDVVILDSKVGVEDGIHAIEEIRDADPNGLLKIILLKSATEMAPTDDKLIKASIDKPFRSTDLLNALRHIDEDEGESMDVKKEKRPKVSRFKRKNDRLDPAPGDSIAKSNVAFGSSYVLFETYPNKIYRFVALFDPEKYDVMIITADKVKAVKERFSYDLMEVMQLSNSSKVGRVSINELGTLTSRIRQFVDKHEHPVVVFDTFSDLMVANGLNQSLLMLHQLMFDESKSCTIGISVDPSALTTKDRGILLHDMIEYKVEE